MDPRLREKEHDRFTYTVYGNASRALQVCRGSEYGPPTAFAAFPCGGNRRTSKVALACAKPPFSPCGVHKQAIPKMVDQ